MGSKMVAVKDLTPGNALADVVLSDSGKILLGKDMVLTQKHISLLNTWDVKNVFISTNEETAIAKPLQDTDRKVNSENYLKFTEEYYSILTNAAQSFDFFRKMTLIPMTPLKEAAGSIRSSILNNGSSVINYLLAGDRKIADCISRHSVMVAFFSGIIASQLKWSEEDIRGVALAGLLHDVGNLAADKFDPQDQANIAEAAVLLKEIKGLSSEVILGIVQHRECIDGSGFPTGANGSRIHPYAKVIAVADTFHAKAYTDEYANPFPVIDLLANEMFGKLDAEVCHTFISRVRDSLLHNKILLSDGQEAEVIYFHPNSSCLPVIKTADDRIIDLSQRGGSTIRRIVSPELDPAVCSSMN